MSDELDDLINGLAEAQVSLTGGDPNKEADWDQAVKEARGIIVDRYGDALAAEEGA